MHGLLPRAAAARGVFMEVAREFIGTDLDDHEFQAKLLMAYHKLWQFRGIIWAAAPYAIQMYADPQAGGLHPDAVLGRRRLQEAGA